MRCVILSASGALHWFRERLKIGSVCVCVSICVCVRESEPVVCVSVIPVSFAPLSSALVSQKPLIFVVWSVFPSQPGLSFSFSSSPEPSRLLNSSARNLTGCGSCQSVQIRSPVAAAREANTMAADVTDYLPCTLNRWALLSASANSFWIWACSNPLQAPQLQLVLAGSLPARQWLHHGRSTSKPLSIIRW